MRVTTCMALAALHGTGHVDPECRGGGEDVIICEKKIRWLQFLKEFNCTATSSWTKNDDNHKYQSWRAWGSRVCKKQLDYIMWPRDFHSTTRYLNKVRQRTCDHFSVVVKIEGEDLRTKMGVKDWAGWIPRSDVENSKIQELVLCASGGRTEIREDEHNGLTALQQRLGKRRMRSRLPRQLSGTRTSSPCRTRSGRMRQRRHIAGTR